MFWNTFWRTLRKSLLQINGKIQKIDGPWVHFRKNCTCFPLPVASQWAVFTSICIYQYLYLLVFVFTSICIYQYLYLLVFVRIYQYICSLIRNLGELGQFFAEMDPGPANFLKFTVERQWRFLQDWAKSVPEHTIIYLLICGTVCNGITLRCYITCQYPP